MLGFNPRSAYCIGVDIGGTKILLLVTDLSGEVVYEVKVPAQSSVEGLVAMIASAWEACGVKREALLGIGVGVPGTVTKEGVVIRARALGWNNLPLQEMLEKQFDCPVFVGNDVNLAALGERWLGSGEQTDHMLFLTIGTGIGGALICGGQLVLGAQNRAGEIGYFLESCDVERGRLNRLGSQGVLEKKCSGSALNQDGRSAKEWFSAYRLGEQEAVARIGAFVRDLSVAIADAVSLLNPGALGAVNFACTQIEQQELR